MLQKKHLNWSPPHILYSQGLLFLAGQNDLLWIVANQNALPLVLEFVYLDSLLLASDQEQNTPCTPPFCKVQDAQPIHQPHLVYRPFISCPQTNQLFFFEQMALSILTLYWLGIVDILLP